MWKLGRQLRVPTGARPIITDLSRAAGLPQLTKICATIGPASEQLPMLRQVVTAGMRIMRLNFSHATYEEADLRMTNLKLSPGKNNVLDNLNLRAVMLDTQGPEIRTGSFAGGVKEVTWTTGQKVVISINDTLRNEQATDKIWISYKKLFNTVTEGAVILLDDGAIEVRVDVIDAKKGELQCTVNNSGSLGNKKGVNMPGLSVELPAMSEKDMQDIKWGIKNDIDYIAASFVRKASDVHEIKAFVSEQMKEHYPVDYPHPKIISKIESTEALVNFDAILAASDGIMVARGDLGVEIPMETLTNVQKDLVRRSNLAGKPVIVATQMLESMQKNPRPTRAECTDVANAVLDGADCVMLSGESAKGKYPVQSILMMDKILEQTEKYGKAHDKSEAVKPDGLCTNEGMAYAVAEASKNLSAACIIVISTTGKTAMNISKFRPPIPIVTIVPNAKAGRLLQMYRGVHPILAPANFNLSEPALFENAMQHAKSMGFCKSNENVIIVSCNDGDEVPIPPLTMLLFTVSA